MHRLITMSDSESSDYDSEVEILQRGSPTYQSGVSPNDSRNIELNSFVGKLILPTIACSVEVEACSADVMNDELREAKPAGHQRIFVKNLRRQISSPKMWRLIRGSCVRWGINPADAVSKVNKRGPLDKKSYELTLRAGYCLAARLVADLIGEKLVEQGIIRQMECSIELEGEGKRGAKRKALYAPLSDRLRIPGWNMNGLSPAMGAEVGALGAENFWDIICLQETKLSDVQGINRRSRVPGYVFYGVKDSRNSTHRGVGICVRKHTGFVNGSCETRRIGVFG